MILLFVLVLVLVPVLVLEGNVITQRPKMDSVMRKRISDALEPLELGVDVCVVATQELESRLTKVKSWFCVAGCENSSVRVMG